MGRCCRRPVRSTGRMVHRHGGLDVRSCGRPPRDVGISVSYALDMRAVGGILPIGEWERVQPDAVVRCHGVVDAGSRVRAGIVEELNDEWFHDGVKASWRRALGLARGVRMKQFLPGHETLTPKCGAGERVHPQGEGMSLAAWCLRPGAWGQGQESSRSRDMGHPSDGSSVGLAHPQSARADNLTTAATWATTTYRWSISWWPWLTRSVSRGTRYATIPIARARQAVGRPGA
jgi:hypothetical protein